MTSAAETPSFLVSQPECRARLICGTEMSCRPWIVTFNRIPHDRQRLVDAVVYDLNRPCGCKPETRHRCPDVQPGRLRTASKPLRTLYGICAVFLGELIGVDITWETFFCYSNL